MILSAEKIVYGQIVTIDSTTFTIKIDGSFTGDTGLITVAKFENWTCASRWTDYHSKQKALFFLNTFNGRLVVMGGGNEGELPIFNNDVYINWIALYRIRSSIDTRNIANKSSNSEDFEPISFQLYGNIFYGIKLDLQTFIKTVENIKSCFILDSKKQSAIVTCSNKEVKKHIKDNLIFRWTYYELVK